MKKALKLALIYLVVLIMGTVFGTLLYSLYLNLLGYISGREITFFKDSELFQSLFYVMPCVLIFAIPAIAYYRIRHPAGVLQLVVFIVLCAVTWVILMPATLGLRDYCNKKFSVSVEREYLTPNYFRKVDDNVYYFTKDFESKEAGTVAEAPAIVINTKEYGEVDYRVLGDYSSFELNRKALPFREIQLKNIFGSTQTQIPVDFKLLINKIDKAYTNDFRQILLLLSFVLIICSVYGITNFFEWRLLNTVILFITVALILCVNSMYYDAQFDVLKSRIMSNGFFRGFSGIVSEPILFLINCLFALIFITIGIVKYAVRQHAKKAR